jgi:DNA-binding NarL/FixJ family response regulator
MTVRVLVVDDQALIRDGLTTLLEASAELEPVAAAANGAEAVALAEAHRPDVVLMDLRMPVLDGVAATEQIKAAHPEIEIVVLTTHADDASILSALRAGARGYLTKDAGMAEISRAVQAAAAGQALLDPVVQTRLVAAALGGVEAGLDPGAGAGAGSAPGGAGSGLRPPGPGKAGPGVEPVSQPPATNVDDLTPRELEVLALIAQGRSNAEIAAALYVSAATVKTHVNHVFAKIGARDRAQAVHYAYTHGLAR